MDKPRTPPGADGGPPPLLRLLIADLKGRDLRGDLRSDLTDLYHFYLDEEDQARLAAMGRLRRALWMAGWLLKGLILKLSPTRRLLLFLALAMVLAHHVRITWLGGAQVELRLWGVVILLLVLMLELKDKLVARDEIDVARQVQLDLLPRRHPAVAGWDVWSTTRPANDVGGDLVDYLSVDGEVGLVLGDVAGKGMGAALLMAKLQATLRALATDHPNLAEMAGRLNVILHRDGLENRFATFFYASIQSTSGQVRWVNAGHNPPFLLRRGREPEELPASGVPLGVFPETRYEERAARLDPGDLLVIYSDGLSEAASETDEEYGPGRLADLLARVAGLPAAEVGAAILADVDRFTGTRRLQDDLSLVLLRRTG